MRRPRLLNFDGTAKSEKEILSKTSGHRSYHAGTCRAGDSEGEPRLLQQRKIGARDDGEFPNMCVAMNVLVKTCCGAKCGIISPIESWCFVTEATCGGLSLACLFYGKRVV